MASLTSLSSPQFKGLIQGLSNDIVNAHINFKFWKELARALDQYPEVYAQSRAFWGHTHKAHLDASVLHLMRAFDQERGSLHLWGWLDKIRDNSQLFTTESFRQRLAENPHVDSLSAGSRTLDVEQLQRDIELCHSSDPLVKLLVRYRNVAIAHRNEYSAATGRDAMRGNSLSVPDYEALLKRAIDIFNRYCSLFDAQIYSTQVIGHDDYRSIFVAVRQYVAASKERNRAWARDFKLQQMYPDL